jgi:hypothetical protein
MGLFDAYLAIDWSARNGVSPARPAENAVWVGERLAPGLVDPTVICETHWRTRASCVAHLRGRLLHHAKAARRVFIGFDFAYGYPAGFCAGLGLTDVLPSWRRVWNELSRLIVDDEKNRNNRFVVAAELNRRCGPPGPGPFWCCRKGVESLTLKSRSPEEKYPYKVREGLEIGELRQAERFLPKVPKVQPTWKLFGQGSVGSQTLVGIPKVAKLRDDPQLAQKSQVWPFETGFTPNPTPARGPFILHAEIWPGVVTLIRDPLCPIRDQLQVRTMVRWLSCLDAQNQLGQLFDSPVGIQPAVLAQCIEEEGWILGAK